MRPAHFVMRLSCGDRLLSVRNYFLGLLRASVLISYFSYGAPGLEAVLTRMNTAKISHARKPLMLAELPTAIDSHQQLSTTM